MKKLIANGIMTSLNASLDFDTASLIAEEKRSNLGCSEFYGVRFAKDLGY